MMSKKLDPAELLEAEQASYRNFGFTATEFTNRMTGTMIDKWSTIYESHIAPTLVDPTAAPKNVKTFAHSVTDALFQRGRFNSIFNTWKEYVTSKVFNVPSNITHPEDEEFEAAAKENDQEALDEEQATLEEGIVKLRAQIELVKRETETTQAAIQAVREFKNAQLSMDH